jgi:hypothetical protein
MGLGTLTMLGMLWTPGQAAPDVHPFNQAKMDIPIRYDPAKKGEIRDLLLFVSRNKNESWEQYAVARPDTDSFFPFTAPADGEYWFQMVIVDKQGRRDPQDVRKAPPALKVLIDTKSPLVTIKALERAGDEATVSWDIQEANPDWSKFVVDFRAGDGLWTPVDARGSLTGTARFRIGQAGPLTVRVQAVDVAGNRSEMTKDAAAPANAAALNQTAARVNVPPDIAPPTGGIGMPPDVPGAPILAPVDPPTRKEPANTIEGQPVAVSGSQGNMNSGLHLPAAQVINVARFDVAYDVEQKGPSGLSRAEVWVTRDDGKSWQKWSSSEKVESPLTVDLATRNNPQVEGVYGLKIVLLSGAGLSKGPPVSGELPDMRVDVDVTPPVVKIYEPVPDPNSKDTMILRWQAVDRNLAADPITLEWSEQADGPWQPIVTGEGNANARRMANSGQHAWKLPANFPTHRVYLRVTARDNAGNLGDARTPHPILVDLNKPVAKIQGIIGATAPERR